MELVYSYERTLTVKDKLKSLRNTADFWKKRNEMNPMMRQKELDLKNLWRG